MKSLTAEQFSSGTLQFCCDQQTNQPADSRKLDEGADMGMMNLMRTLNLVMELLMSDNEWKCSKR